MIVHISVILILLAEAGGFEGKKFEMGRKQDPHFAAKNLVWH